MSHKRLGLGAILFMIAAGFFGQYGLDSIAASLAIVSVGLVIACISQWDRRK